MARLGGEMWKDGYPPEVYEEILEKVASGIPVKVICREEGMPHYTGLYAKCRKDPELKAELRYAQEWQSRSWLEDIAERLPDIRDGVIDPKCANVWINGTKMLVEKLAPREYGVKTQVDHSGSIQQVSDEELDKRIAELLSSSTEG